MIKAVATLIAGSLLGAGAVDLVIRESGDSDPSAAESKSLVEAVADFALGRDRAGEARVLTVAQSLAAYRAAAAETDAADLAAALEAAAASPWSPAKDVEIEALLARLAELAPAAAPALARGLGLEPRFVADAYVYWAQSDPEAAIGGLAAIENRGVRHDVALALLDVFGDDAAGLDRVSAGLPAPERVPLRVEWIAARAEQDPYGAFREAESLTEMSQAGRALEQVGIAWAARDPLGAIAQADLLSEQLRSRYFIGVFREWARLDVLGYLDWLESAASPPTQAVVGLQLIAGSHPDLVMSIADGMSGNIGQQARLMSMQALAETDPGAAMTRVAAMPAGQDRENMLMTVGSAVARRDPGMALAWARSLSPPSRNLTTQVVLSIAQSDPERVLEFLDDPPPGVDPQMIASLATSALTRDPDQAQVLADKLVASDSIQSANALRNLVGNWVQMDPGRALEWVLAHDSQVDAAVLGSAAQSIARADPVAAAAYVDRIPSEYRSAWISQVAGPFGLYDPNAALAWVTQFQGQDVFDNALRSVITGMAQVDARAAAQAVAQASPDVQLGAAASVATALAREDPRAAARFAESLVDERARRSAIGSTVSVWAVADFSAAQRYTLGLDRGDARDQALSTLILRSAQSGDVDRGLLNAFSSDRATQDALARAIPLVSREDPDEARELLGRVTSLETRRQIEEQIDALR